MKFSWKSLFGLIYHGSFLAATIIITISSLPYVERVPLKCLGPFISNIGMGIGNLMLVSQFGGKLVCELFNDKKVTISVPGCGTMMAGILAGSAYFWGLVLVSNEKPDYCHHEIPDNLWAMIGSHLVNGLVHVVFVFVLILYRMIGCCRSNKRAEKDGSEKV